MENPQVMDTKKPAVANHAWLLAGEGYVDVFLYEVIKLNMSRAQ